MEVSSRNTWLEDIGNKKALCARLGVADYFLFDPEEDVVKPALQGFRLTQGEYRRIASARDGSLPSKALGLSFWLDADQRLRARITKDGTPLLRAAEVREQAARDRERADALEARLRELESWLDHDGRR